MRTRFDVAGDAGMMFRKCVLYGRRASGGSAYRGSFAREIFLCAQAQATQQLHKVVVAANMPPEKLKLRRGTYCCTWRRYHGVKEGRGRMRSRCTLGMSAEKQA